MAHPDLDQLFEALFPFAQLMLSEHGEFYPFGATMQQDGEIVSIGARDDDDDHPPSQHLIDLLTRAFHRQVASGSLRAAGICYDVCIIPPGESVKTDAICCSLEHLSGESVDVFVPYQRNDRDGVRYGKTFAQRRSRQFFAQLQ
jgi:hypothetical protein